MSRREHITERCRQMCILRYVAFGGFEELGGCGRPRRRMDSFHVDWLFGLPPVGLFI